MYPTTICFLSHEPDSFYFPSDVLTSTSKTPTDTIIPATLSVLKSRLFPASLYESRLHSSFIWSFIRSRNACFCRLDFWFSFWTDWRLQTSHWRGLLVIFLLWPTLTVSSTGVSFTTLRLWFDLQLLFWNWQKINKTVVCQHLPIPTFNIRHDVHNVILQSSVVSMKLK